MFYADFPTAYVKSRENCPASVLARNLAFEGFSVTVSIRARRGNHGGCDRLSKAFEEVPKKQRQECSAIQAMQVSPVAGLERKWKPVQKIGKRPPSRFDEGLQPGEGLIPLLGDEIEILLEAFDGTRIEFEEIFATGLEAANHSRAMQDTKMFADRLPGQP